MNEQSLHTKQRVLGALRSSGETFVATLRSLPAEAFEQGRYESGWNARQILAHVASIEWSYPRLLDVARESVAAGVVAPKGPVRRTEPEQASGLPTRVAQGGIDAYNERQVAKRAGASVTDLLAEFQRNRAVLIEAVDAADDRLFAAPIRSAGGVTGTLGDVLQAVAVQHILGHMRDIAGTA